MASLPATIVDAVEVTEPLGTNIYGLMRSVSSKIHHKTGKLSLPKWVIYTV